MLTEKKNLCFDIRFSVEHGFMLRSDFKQKVFIIPPYHPTYIKPGRGQQSKEKRDPRVISSERLGAQASLNRMEIYQ